MIARDSVARPSKVLVVDEVCLADSAPKFVYSKLFRYCLRAALSAMTTNLSTSTIETLFHGMYLSSEVVCYQRRL